MCFLRVRTRLFSILRNTYVSKVGSLIWGVPVAVCNIQCSALLGDRSSACEGAGHCSKGSLVGLDTKRKPALHFIARWTSETEADVLNLVRANLQEQVKVTLHLRQCRIGNVNAEDPLPPALSDIYRAQRLSRLHKATLLHNAAP